jgi:hypothetical protein
MNFAPDHPLHPDVCKCWDCAVGSTPRDTEAQAAIAEGAKVVREAEQKMLQGLAPSPRTCHYCQTSQRTGIDCTYCGAPDDGKRGPLTMAPMRLIFA